MSKRIVIVTGDRHAKEHEWGELVETVLEVVNDGYHDYGAEAKAVLIHGDAQGIDAIAKKYWISQWGYKTQLPFPAPWSECEETFGDRNAAGPLRNHLMLAELLFWQQKGWEGCVLAFHNNLYGGSRGTRNMVQIAKAAGVKVRTFKTT